MFFICKIGFKRLQINVLLDKFCVIAAITILYSNIKKDIFILCISSEKLHLLRVRW